MFLYLDKYVHDDGAGWPGEQEQYNRGSDLVCSASHLQGKRYSRIDQHLARHFKYKGSCLSSPPPFLCSQIITPSSNSMISTNQETGL